MTQLTNTEKISLEDLALIKKSRKNLDEISFLMRALNTIGTPIDSGLELLPETVQHKINDRIQKALQLAVKANLKTFNKEKTNRTSSNITYKLITGLSGATGGFFGVAGFSADLILSTKFMMRSIMDIARSQGENIHEIEAQLACLQVFALGGSSEDDDELDTSYYATRAALHTTMNQASSYIAENGTKKIIETITSQTAAPIAKLINQIAARFSVQVGEKFVAQAIPVIGAAAGASINVLFISHFQKMATAHFTLRRLERKYSKELIEETYTHLRLNSNGN
ncbi:EcsC family protein [Leeuwenhoekiella marinoflava]|uniref:EcsC family protein n=2 Tax=Leeuwenhoekiella marinoflava TaxID=988 RepID=A0A4Q0PET1_9FLAO|nr:EcsC family protein [Leeuwenhoekiella marinoflava]RXG25006.1 EcsC family protein [Leeuwenhoekiella marinoflava]SHF91712.1 EcsC protein family protein [Leeuwenhoekiella marinoflava DSM 3653]